MSDIRRAPAASLRPLVRWLWSSDPDAGAIRLPSAREHVLPTGTTHLVVRLSGQALRLYDAPGAVDARTVGDAIIGGARSAYYVRDVSIPGASVGALLRPGAASALLGVPERALAGQHTPLECVIGEAATNELREQVSAESSGAGRLAAFEQWLVRRAQDQSPTLHPCVAPVLPLLYQSSRRVADLVTLSGLSHRHFLAQVRECTGLLPSEHLQLQRFRSAMRLALASPMTWAELALTAGYADQAHLAHAFGRIAGVTPKQWRKAVDRRSPQHLRR